MMPYDIYNNRIIEETPVVYEQPSQQEQAPQISAYQQRMSQLPNAKYLTDDYQFDNWARNAEQRGITGDATQNVMYRQRIKPLIDAARDDEIRESFLLASHPDTDPQVKTDALAKLAYYMKDPDLVNNTNLKRMKNLQGMGLMENPSYNGGGGGHSEYGGDDQNAMQIYSHLKSKGLADNVIAGIMGNLQQESGFNPNVVGDGGNSIGLAQWYQDRGNSLRNFAQQRGTDWNHLGTQLDYLLDEINRGYPDLIKQMSSMNPHEAAILFHDVFERSADTPEMKAQRGRNAEAIFNGRRVAQPQQQFIADPNYVSPKDKFNRQIYERDRDYALKMANYDRMVNQDNMRYGNGGRSSRVSQQAFDKANASMRNSALNLAQFQDINPEEQGDVKKYETNMNKFANDIGNLCQMYDDGTKDSVSFGIALYNELNKTRSGLRPETLAEGVARAVFARRGDIDAGDLQREILKYIYNGGRQQQNEGNSVADFRRYDYENPFSYKALDVADSRRNSWDNAFR